MQSFTGPEELQRRFRYQADEEELPSQQHHLRGSTASTRDVRGSKAFKDVPTEETEKERLYEAFNDLQAVAKRFDKPFEAPAVLVLGHQTDGKSALVEALIGFQFNQVGGGTTTRRPIVLRLQFDPSCHQPAVSCVLDDMTEQAMSLTELQAYIQEANHRLEEQKQFSPKEILVNIRYRHSPNLCIIDTPGLIAAAPGKANEGLQAASRAIEALVRAKAEVPSLILLCLEDSNDWSHATTRRLVMQADPNLSRTVLVSTKFDTRIATFSRPADVEAFLHPSSLGNMLGGSPFFTSVPAGRVGSDQDSVYAGDPEFRAALNEREALDVSDLEARLQRRLDGHERTHLGVSALRTFLESLLRESLLREVPAVLSALEREHRLVQQKQQDKRAQLRALNQADLKDKGRRLTEDFITHLSSLLHGNARPPVDKFGQTLEQEQEHAGCFTLPSGEVLPVPEAVPNAAMRLYGGAQFHRAMAEFRVAVGQMACPELSREEVANACGLEDAHDGANYLRAACVIAVAKARAIFEPFLHQLGARLSHVLRNMLPATVYMLQADGAVKDSNMDALTKVVGESFNNFIDSVESTCRARCLEDLLSTTRFVTWSLHARGGKSLKTMLGKVKIPAEPGAAGAKPSGKHQAGDAIMSPSALADLLLEVLFTRQITSTSEDLVTQLVAQMFEGIRDYCVQSAELKFWCFFLMPIVDTFPQTLRSHMENLYETNLDAVFNTTRARDQLEGTIKELDTELQQVERLLAKFAGVQESLQKQAGGLRTVRQSTISLSGPDQGPSQAERLAARYGGTTTSPASSPLKMAGGSRPKLGQLGRPPMDADTVRDASIKSAAQAPKAGLVSRPI